MTRKVLRRPFRLPGLVLGATAMLGGCASMVPNPLEKIELVAQAEDLQMRAVAYQDPITGTISLYEAMARALKYNLDYRLEMMQTSLRGAEAKSASLEMLPKLVANSVFSQRNNDLASGHLDLPTGIDVPPTTTSQDHAKATADITFSWNVLDFALSYVRARQAADKYLIAEEQKRKIIQRIIEDVRTAYWRASSAERMLKRIEALEARAQKAIASARALQQSGDLAPTAALTFERELVKIKQLSQQLARELTLARAQLAALMDLPPHAEFKLSGDGDLKPPVLGLSGREMVAEALFNRPELREITYERRINEQELTAAYLDLLPGAQLFITESADTNHYLLHQHWLSMGATAAHNLIRVFQLPAKRSALFARDEMLDTKLLAMAMVIMTQVHVSRTRYHHFSLELAINEEYRDVQSKLVEQIRAQAAADAVGEQTLVREEMNFVVADLRRDIAFVNQQNAAANVFVSMGLELQANEVNHALDVKALAGHLRSLWSQRAGVSPRAKYLMELEAIRLEAKRREEEVARQARLDAALRARQAEIARAQEVARNSGGGLKDTPSGRYGGLKDDYGPPRQAGKPYSGVK